MYWEDVMLPMHPALAEEHLRDLRAAADRSRLVAFARSTSPTPRHRAVPGAAAALTRLSDWIRRGQLGPAPNYCVSC
jgi:hypothetical protein